MIDILGPGALGMHCALALPKTTAVRLRHPKGNGAAWTIRQETGAWRSLTCLNLTDESPIDQLIVTTKAAQVAAAVAAVRPHLTADAEVLLLHNGLGPQAAVAELLAPSQRLYVGVSTEGVVRTGPLQMSHRSAGLTQVGPWTEMLPPPRIYSALAAGTWTMRWVDHPQLTQRMVWQKLIINLAINPLTALHQVANGALAATEFQERWRPLVQEACAIGTAAGIDLEATTECERVLNVIQSTAHNHSSMFQDWAQGRPSEIDFVALPFITHARQHGLNPTAIAALYAQVKSQEAAGRHR